MPNTDPAILQKPTRLALLRDLDVLDTPAEAAFDRLTRMVRQILGVPVSLVSLVDADRQFFKSQCGLPEPWATERQTLLSHSFCQHTVANGAAGAGPLLIEDARLHPLVHDNLAIRDLKVIAYAGIPLTTSSGQTLGSLCAIDHQPRQWADAEIALLSDLGQSVITELELRGELNKRRRAESALREHVEQLTLMRRLEGELSATLDVDAVLATTMDIALRISGAEYGFVGLLEQDELTLAQRVGPSHCDHLPALNDGLIGRALRRRQPELMRNLKIHNDCLSPPPGVTAQIVIPLINRGALVGVLNLETGQPERFTEAAFDFLKLIAGRIAAALDNARLYRLTQHQVDELQGLYQRVRELEQLKTDMVQVASHDLKNPLAVVRGMSELLIHYPDNLSADQLEQIQAIHDSSLQMQAIITEILSLERIEAMHENSQSTCFDLRDVVAEVYKAYEPEARRRRLTYRLMLPEIPALMEGDPAQLREALGNLIGNALKYTPDAGMVFSRLRIHEGRLRFEVEDTGPGIPADQQGRLFEPFFRAESVETRGIAGTGLGLHLVKRIVLRHNGHIRFRSEYGRGSIFGFDVPPASLGAARQHQGPGAPDAEPLEEIQLTPTETPVMPPP
ncbi:MAG: GAF domain-containing protein [Chloroflexi bacterium]|nr:GAF domain-containing protein [Chloroflexota bacterium]